MSAIVFYVLAVITVIGALGVVLDRNVVRATLSLLIAMLGVAGIFLVAYAEFLALAQILIYAGAVTIVILFAIMLTRTTDLNINLDNPQRPVAFLIAVGVFVLLTLTFIYSDVPQLAEPDSVAVAIAESNSTGFETVGDSLFNQWAIPFEIASVILLVAMVGAIALARGDDNEPAVDASVEINEVSA
ncbi:MAG: NADH-quinone oxidoreductase subunit J [Chloroflexi bacterium]|nr:NADH-quinone oxidoreductase subunit J [Chloroflexota bacterium]